MNLKALNGERSESIIAIDRLQVARSKDGNTRIKLPRIYTRKHLPVDKKEIATPEKIEELDYLKTISSEITQTDDTEVGLVIGANCIKVLEPLKVIVSNNGAPYTYQTCLGWCIVGPISNMIGCHCIVVHDAISSKTADHQFVVDESMKEISLEEMFQKMHQNEFVEKEVISVNGFLENMMDISTDDKGIISKAFLKTEESTIKSGDHYIVPFPFKKESLIIPNNRNQAIQRLIYLKRRFNKDPTYFEDYKQFMNNLIVKGYTKRLDDSPVGRTWYILHHGVYHPSKPRKTEQYLIAVLSLLESH